MTRIGGLASEIERLKARLSVRDAEVRKLTAELEAERARRYEPGPVVQPSLFGGWMVYCLACEASTLIGLRSKETAVALAGKHVHVYPDAEGFVPNGAWPS